MYKIKYVMRGMFTYVNHIQYEAMPMWDRSFYQKINTRRAVPQEVKYEQSNENLDKVVKQGY